MSARPKRLFTPDEYLALEEKAAYKSQYVAGEIFAMAGAETWHDKVVTNLLGMFYLRFLDRPCEHFSSDVRVHVEAADLFTYPDVSALCGQAILMERLRPRSLLNPQVIIEVLSPSTEAYDRGAKFACYQRLESLVDYVLVSAERTRVELFTRQGNGTWLYREHTHPEDSLRLVSVDCELPLRDIYRKVNFPPAL